VGNEKILENIARISRVHPYTIVRVPLISEVNANEQNIHMMCQFITSHTGVKGVELLPYHDFGESKYRAVGAQVGKFTTPEAATINNLKKIIADYNIPVVDFK
jgi:pyruvate formate lyase activating enzyme